MRTGSRCFWTAAILAVVLATVIAGGALAGPAGAAGGLRAGVGMADITPDLGRNFDGYVRPDTFSKGVAMRLEARALVLQRGDVKLALVAVDLMSAGGDLQRGVAEKVKDLGFTDKTIYMTGTHTHAGPDLQINSYSTTSMNADVKAFLIEQIAKAVRRANSGLGPAVAGWASAEVSRANINRSLEAHLANHGMDFPPHTQRPTADPEGPGHTIDPTLHLLRVDALKNAGGGRPQQVPLAAWFRFSAHDTAFPPANDYYSSDWSMIAQQRFENGLAAEGKPGLMAMFANGTEGDMVSVNDSYNAYATADSQGIKIAGAMRVAWEQAGGALSAEPAIAVRNAAVNLSSQQVEGGQTAPIPIMGLPFLGGAENGPSIFYQPGELEGKRRPAELADPIYGRKILVAAVPFATKVRITQVRVGDAIIAGVPGEPTIEVGRRIQAAMTKAGATPEAGIKRIVVTGLTQDFTGYFTTPEEYEQQHYEGGSTVHGKWSANLLNAVHADLADRLVHGKPDPDPQADLAASSVGEAPDLTGDGGSDGVITEQPAQRVARLEVVTMKWTGGASGKDRPLDAPFLTLERDGSAVGAPSGGAAPRRGLPATGSGVPAAGLIMVAAAGLGLGALRRKGSVGGAGRGGLSRRRLWRAAGVMAMVGALTLTGLPGSLPGASAASWQKVTDDFDFGFQWRFDDVSSTYSVAHEVPVDLATGAYRLKVTSKRYTLISQTFEIVASERLAVRGVTATPDGGSTVITFQAAMPAPDPAKNLLHRDRVPTGGKVNFSLRPGNASYVANYDAATRTWTARVPGTLGDAEVVVPDHGLMDAWGNTSGKERAYAFGKIDDLAWPPTMPVGGFCVPGATGQGCFYPDWIYPWPPGPQD